MTIDLYNTSGSPPCRTVRMLAKLLDVPLNVVDLDLAGKEHHKPEFVKVSRDGWKVGTSDDSPWLVRAESRLSRECVSLGSSRKGVHVGFRRQCEVCYTGEYLKQDLCIEGFLCVVEEDRLTNRAMKARWVLFLCYLRATCLLLAL